jgi:putative SbcD/Mre11-related phosphoesterase
MKSEIKYVGKCLLLTNGRESVLAIGDLHLGYGESLNRSGVLVSRQMFKEVISELDEVFAGIGGKVDRVVLLGDIKHDFGRILKQEWSDVLGLFDYLTKKCRKIVVIRGNHDTILKPIARKRGIHVKNYWVWKEFCFTHGDEDYRPMWSKKVECLVLGHGHPALRLSEGARSEKYKCFLTGKFRGKTMIVLPSFSEWYAGSDPREGEVVLAWDVNFGSFEVRAVGEKLEVLDFGKLRSIKER